MKTHRPPRLTVTLVATMLVLHMLPIDRALLFFSMTDITSGQVWRLLSGHLVHADWNHLLWNSLGLLLLGVLIERRSRALLAGTLAAGTTAVNLLLLSPYTGLDYYCGLSGVLNALLVVALWLEWQVSRSWWLVAIALACFSKLLIEVSTGDAVISRTSWPPYPWSHVAGVAGGISVLLISWFRAKEPVTGTVLQADSGRFIRVRTKLSSPR